MDLTRRELMKELGAAAVAVGALGAAGCAAPRAAAAPLAAAAAVGDRAAGELGDYKLPPLPYAYDALEPHLSKQTLTLHHDKHHAGYVLGLNGALAKLARARADGNAAVIPALTRALAFHGSGHLFHSIYWSSMKPGGGGKPTRGLAQLIPCSFGSFDTFVAHFAAVTKSIRGSGWGVLAYEPVGQRLVVLGAEKHENVLFAGTVPLMVCDVWEHAYYLTYQNRRAAYVDVFLKNLVDWGSIEKRLAAAV